MRQPKISVIVPVYKVDKYLMQCIDSILAQTLTDFELYLVDEGDRDVSYAIMKFFEGNDSRVRVIHKKCGGYGSACNLALESVSGEYLSIIESDDFIEPTMFQELYEKAKKLDVDVIKAPYYLYFDAYNNTDPRREECPHREIVMSKCPEKVFSILESPILMAIHPSIWSGLYRRDFINSKKIRFIEAPGAGYVDNAFRIETLIEATRIVWHDVPCYNYRCSNPNASVAPGVFNISVMLQRWKEVHEYLAHKSSDIRSKIAPFLIIEEYRCTFSKVYDPDMNDYYFQIMKDNLSYTSSLQVKTSPVLDKQMIRLIENIRQAKTLTGFRAKDILFRRLKNIIQTRFLFSNNHVLLHFMATASREVFSIRSSFGGFYTLDLLIGKKPYNW